MHLRHAVAQLFKTTDLFKIFDLKKGASDAEVKKAFYKLCQRYHPDKVAEADRETATKHFQIVSAIYELLIDPKRRSIYDKTGEILDGDQALSDDFDWEAYVAQFKRVTADEIASFSAVYKGSEEELADLRAAYQRHEGNLDAVMQMVPLAEVLEDEERFRKILNGLIASGDVPAFAAFVNEPEAKRRKRHDAALRERRRFEIAEAKLKEQAKAAASSKSGKQQKHGLAAGDDQSLVALIQSRNQSCFSNSFLDSLAQKYSEPKQRKAAKSGGSAGASKRVSNGKESDNQPHKSKSKRNRIDSETEESEGDSDEQLSRSHSHSKRSEASNSATKAPGKKKHTKQ